MPFKKGQSGNPKWRPSDPISQLIRETIQEAINPNKLKSYLSGDAEKKAMLAEYTLVSKNEKASGAVFDLTTS